MRPYQPFSFLASLIILTALACNLPQQAITTPVPTDTPTPTNTPTPTVTPTDIPLPAQTTEVAMPTAIPPTSTPEPTLPPYQPVGFFVVPQAGGSIVVYDRNNQVIAQLSAPGLFGDNPAYTHLAGHLSNGTSDLSIAFFSWENNSLMLTNLGGVSTLRNVENFYMLAGIPAYPYLAYTQVEYAESALRSSLTAGDFISISTAPSVMTVVDTSIYAVRPLAISHDHGNPLGVYYTTIPYGIGGDIVFEPRRSLSYLDLATYQSWELLGLGSSPSVFSPDLSWLAFTPVHVGAMSIAPISDLNNPITLPLLPDSDRGAGAAVFSPDNQYVAWKEGSGWMMSETPNFHATIRIATTSGAITAQIPDSAIAALVGNPSSISVEPVGWLDAGTLLLEVRGDDWGNASLLRVSPDGSGLAFLVSGGFMGFVYP